MLDSIQSYHFTDPPLAEGNNYYRLVLYFSERRQPDFAGPEDCIMKRFRLPCRYIRIRLTGIFRLKPLQPAGKYRYLMCWAEN